MRYQLILDMGAEKSSICVGAVYTYTAQVGDYVVKRQNCIHATLYVNDGMTKKHCVLLVNHLYTCISTYFNHYLKLFIFPLQVKNKPQDGVVICAFILKVGMGMNNYALGILQEL